MSQWDHPTFDLDRSGTFVPLEWDPPPVGVARPSRWRQMVTVTAALLLLVASGAMGWLAYRNHQSAQHWRQLDQTRAAQITQLTAELQQANATVRTVDGQLNQLKAQVSGLQSQLSSSSTQNSNLQQELSNAGSVAGNLQQCIDATNHLNSDANSFGSLFDFGSVQKESKNVDQTCKAAESADQGLQSNLQSQG